MFLDLVVAVVLAISVVGNHAATVYHNQGVGVQLFEWSWADVANECETFLSKKGYRAVQVSPPQEHIAGSQWWTRYQPVSYTLVSRSGDEAEFDDMVRRCVAVGVEVVVDAVINHMAAGSGMSIMGTTFGRRTFPGLYSPQDFHHDANNVYTNCEVNNYNNQSNVQNCDLVGLADLATGSEYVQSTIANYLNDLYRRGVRGLRIDAAKHQEASQLGGILKRLPNDMYVGMEVIGSQGEAVQPSMYFSLGQVSEFYYADDLDYNIINENKMIYLQTFGESWGLIPDQYAAVFLDNHDTQRNGRAQLTYKNGTLYEFANLFMLAFPYGHTRVMSSYYFSDTDQGPPAVGVQDGLYCNDGKNWVCEHRTPSIANMVAWRNTAGVADVALWQVGANNNEIAFARGKVAFIALNRNTNAAWRADTLQTGLSAGDYCNVIVSDDRASCPVVTVSAAGTVSLSVPSLSAVAIHVNCKKN